MKNKLFIFLFICVCVLMFSSKVFAMSEIGDNGVKLDNLFDANEKELRKTTNVWQLYKNNGGYTYTKLTSAE